MEINSIGIKSRALYGLRGLVLALFVGVVAVSCKSRKIIADGSLDTSLSAKGIIRAHYQNQLDFKTISGKMKIDYSDGESSQSVSVSLRMKKNEAIWISAPLGIVKAYITPDRVSYYNKLQNEYFEGDFSYLSNLLGTELDFDKVQNLLLGQALFDLREERYDVSISGGNYQLEPHSILDLFTYRLLIEPKNFKIASQRLSQPLKNRMLDIQYKNYQKIYKWILPNEILVLATEGDRANTVQIEYRNMEFDQSISFPYSIPKGYKEIVLTKDDL